MLGVVRERFGACPTREVLDSPLPTALLADTDRLPAPPVPAPACTFPADAKQNV